MANTATENEADSGSNIVPIALRQLEKQDDDQTEDRVTGSNSNYDSSEGGHKCTRCDFEASTATALKNHITISHASPIEPEMEVAENNNPPADRSHRKMFECDVCNMKFSNGANMRRHKMRHTGVKPYECRVCQKRFFRKDHLAEHFTTHTKTLPYHCPICNRGFQRQIAMRAHFQNEHVGQHELVKSCPMCNYRAGSMKSLRIHFFNRHGIDLDNPGAPPTQAELIAAATQQGFSPVDGALSSLNQLGSNLSVSVTSGANFSDSGDSNGNRSADNATPPMHFLTPHVEISMADAPASLYSPSTDSQQRTSNSSQPDSRCMANGDSPSSPQSADSNSNAPTSSHIQPNSLRMEQETNITPSISLIPIKQEPGEEYNENLKRNGPGSVKGESDNVTIQNATSSSLSSLIKVSPLKSLLRDDLKRKLISRSNSSSRARSTSSPNNGNSESSPLDGNNITNGTITSTGSEQPSDSSQWRVIGKRNLQCSFCGIGFPDQTLYFLHKGCHSDANPWKCNICSEQCCNVYEFNSHLLSKSHQ